MIGQVPVQYTPVINIDGKNFRAHSETFFDPQSKQMVIGLIIDDIDGDSVINSYELRSDKGKWHDQLIMKMSPDYYSKPSIEGKEGLQHLVSYAVCYLGL